MKKITIKASQAAKQRKNVKASKSIQDMLNAFEAKLAEAGVESSTDVECCDTQPIEGSDERDDRAVTINEGDYYVLYTDEGGGFDADGEIISLADIKQYWNDNNSDDPILNEYASFKDWFKDTKDNFLKEYYE